MNSMNWDASVGRSMCDYSQGPDYYYDGGGSREAGGWGDTSARVDTVGRSALDQLDEDGLPEFPEPARENRRSEFQPHEPGAERPGYHRSSEETPGLHFTPTIHIHVPHRPTSYPYPPVMGNLPIGNPFSPDAQEPPGWSDAQESRERGLDHYEAAQDKFDDAVNSMASFRPFQAGREGAEAFTELLNGDAAFREANAQENQAAQEMANGAADRGGGCTIC